MLTGFSGSSGKLESLSGVTQQNSGEDWREKIRQAITGDALVFIACFSSTSVSRDTSYQFAEISLAIEHLRQCHPGKPWLIPVRFDDCRIPDWVIGGVQTLASIQRADLFGEHRDAAAERLTGSVARLLGVEQPPVPEPPDSVPASPQEHLTTGRRSRPARKAPAPAMARWGAELSMRERLGTWWRFLATPRKSPFIVLALMTSAVLPLSLLPINGIVGTAFGISFDAVYFPLILYCTLMFLYLIGRAVFFAGRAASRVFMLTGPFLAVGGLAAVTAGLITGQGGFLYGGLICTGLGPVWLITMKYRH